MLLEGMSLLDSSWIMIHDVFSLVSSPLTLWHGSLTAGQASQHPTCHKRSTPSMHQSKALQRYLPWSQQRSHS